MEIKSILKLRVNEAMIWLLDADYDRYRQLKRESKQLENDPEQWTTFARSFGQSLVANGDVKAKALGQAILDELDPGQTVISIPEPEPPKKVARPHKPAQPIRVPETKTSSDGPVHSIRSLEELSHYGVKLSSRRGG